MSDNLFIGAGLLTRFEEKTTPNGNRVCAFSILLPSRGKQDDNKKQGTFIPVESWNVSPQMAKLFTERVKKCRVFVKGELKLDYWQDKQTGTNRTQLKLIAEVVSYLPMPEKRTDQPQTRTTSATAQPAAQGAPVASTRAAQPEQQFDTEGNLIPF